MTRVVLRLLSVIGIRVETVEPREVLELEMWQVPPGGLVTMWVGDEDEVVVRPVR